MTRSTPSPHPTAVTRSVANAKGIPQTKYSINAKNAAKPPQDYTPTEMIKNVTNAKTKKASY